MQYLKNMMVRIGNAWCILTHMHHHKRIKGFYNWHVTCLKCHREFLVNNK